MKAIPILIAVLVSYGFVAGQELQSRVFGGKDISVISVEEAKKEAEAALEQQDVSWSLPTPEDLKNEREGGVEMTKIAERIETIVHFLHVTTCRLFCLHYLF